MKRFLLGALAGVVIVCLVLFGMISSGTPFRAVSLNYGGWQKSTVIATPAFVIVYEDAPCNGGGGGRITIAGKDGPIPAPWRGYPVGWSGSEKGIDYYTEYNPSFGRATIFLDGKLVLVEEDGVWLRVQRGRFDLRRGPVTVIVDRAGTARQLDAGEDAAFRKSLPAWFGSQRLQAYPPTGL